MFRKKMALIPSVLLKLETAKNVVRKMSKKIRFKTPFDSQHAKGSQTLRNSSAKHFYHIFLTTLGDADLENISLTNICDLSTVNAMTAADMYSLPERENLPQPI